MISYFSNTNKNVFDFVLIKNNFVGITKCINMQNYILHTYALCVHFIILLLPSYLIINYKI